MQQAGPQDTFDHLLGSGALGYDWWHGCTTTGVSPDSGDVSPEWTATITADDGDGGEITETIDHAAVIRAARKVLSPGVPGAGEALRRECKALLFDADDADLDAGVADELLQVLILGEVVFG